MTDMKKKNMKWLGILIPILIALIGAAIYFGLDRQKRDAITIQIQPESFAHKELEKAANQVNASCPIKAGSHSILEGAKFEKDKWTYFYTVQEDSVVLNNNQLEIDQMEANMKEAIRNQLLSGNSMLTMIEALIKVKADLHYLYHGEKSGTTFTVVFTYPELRVMKDVMTSKY